MKQEEEMRKKMGEKMVAGVPGYPTAGFLMALVLLTADARTGILSGILVIWLTVFAFLMKNLLGRHVPVWSRDSSVLIGTVSLSRSGQSCPDRDSVSVLVCVPVGRQRCRTPGRYD